MYKSFTLVILLLAFGISDSALSQGFKSYNGRNHPELEWVWAETEHFRIHYPKHLEGIQHEAATVAEETYAALSTDLNVQFGYKIRIYLSDEDQISNGFAVPFRRGFTDLWVNVNDFAETWTGQEKWLRKVIAHELAHLFHFEKTKTNMGLWNYLFNDPLPRYWSEGYAQYATEKWDAQRGDRWLRRAVFDNNISLGNLNSIDNGRLIYAAGNSQLRYFSQLYGDSTLERLHAWRDTVGFLRMYDFFDAYEEVMDEPYARFRDRWLKHINVYYNSLAASMERVDSLGDRPLRLPGQFYFAADIHEKSERLALLSLESTKRPVYKIWVISNADSIKPKLLTDGAIEPHLRWSPDGSKIAFARVNRGEHGSLLPDIYLIDARTGKIKQITDGRKAVYPVFTQTGNGLYFVGIDGPSANIYFYDLVKGTERRITSHPADYQIISLDINHKSGQLLFSSFDDQRNRHLVLLDPETGKEQILDDGIIDNRNARFTSDGREIIYNSLRDDVPNVFRMNLETGLEQRLTNLFAGAEFLSFVLPDSTGEAQIIVSASETRDKDFMFKIKAKRTAKAHAANIPVAYTQWTRQQSPHIIPWKTEIQTDLITKTGKHNAFKDISHVLSFGLPLYDQTYGFNAFGFSTWMDPLFKHSFTAFFSVTPSEFDEQSFFLFNYVNNTFAPSLSFSAFKIPQFGQFYGGDIILNDLVGGEISASWPINAFDRPYESAQFITRGRYARFRPIRLRIYDDNLQPSPQDAIQSDLSLYFQWKKQRPYRFNDLHPLDGIGVSLGITGATSVLASEVEFLRTDASAFAIVPAVWKTNFFVYGRGVYQSGRSLNQDFVGLSRFDNVSIPGSDLVETIYYATADRVRGHREFIVGDKVAFGSLEYRIPLIPSLQTNVLGEVLSLGGLSASVFADAGIVDGVNNIAGVETRQLLGAGWEIKNVVSFGGLNISHAFGAGYADADFNGKPDYHYRIRAVLPF